MTTTLRESALAAHREEEARQALEAQRRQEASDQRDEAELLKMAVQFFGDFIPVSVASGARGVEIVWAMDPENGDAVRPTVEIEGVTFERNRGRDYMLRASMPRAACGHVLDARVTLASALADLGNLLARATHGWRCEACEDEKVEPTQSAGDRLLAAIREAMAPEVPF